MLQLFIGILTIAVLGAVFLVVPPAEGLGDYVRLAFFHIPVAWVSVLAFLMSAWWAAAYLRKGSQRVDALSAGSAKIGLIFVLLATVSGAIFSKMTWGAYWNWDPRQTTIFVLLLIYGAYLTLRSAIPGAERRARAGAGQGGAAARGGEPELCRMGRRGAARRRGCDLSAGDGRLTCFM